MHRSAFGQRDPEEVPQRETVGAAPGNASLALDTLKVADQEHPDQQFRIRDGSRIEGRVQTSKKAAVRDLGENVWR